MSDNLLDNFLQKRITLAGPLARPSTAPFLDPLTRRPMTLKASSATPETSAAGRPSPELERLLRQPSMRKSINRIVRNRLQVTIREALAPENVLRMVESLLSAEDSQPGNSKTAISVSVLWNRQGRERSLEGRYKTSQEWFQAAQRAASEMNACGYLIISRAYRRDFVDQRPPSSFGRLLNFFRGNWQPDLNPTIPQECFIAFGEDDAGASVAAIYPIVTIVDGKRGIGFPIPIEEDMPSPFRGILPRKLP